MRNIREATVEEIVGHLDKLGEKNRRGNLDALNAASKYFHVELSFADFRSLIFIQIDETRPFCRNEDDRRLQFIPAYLEGRNSKHWVWTQRNDWNMNDWLEQSKSHISRRLPWSEILLIDANPTESVWVPVGEDGWTIQDGNHRALARMWAIHSGRCTFDTQLAYVATNRDLLS